MTTTRAARTPLLAAVLLATEFSLRAATIVVNDATDTVHASGCAITGTGTCSLRDAITFANTTPGSDAIAFAIPGSGLHVIALASALPIVTDPLVIDGFTQPGSSPNMLATADNAIRLIQIVGSMWITDPGLTITAPNTVLRGLDISGFGIDIESDGSNNRIQGCLLHVSGYAVVVGGTATGTVVGGTNPGDRNIVIGNSTGVLLGGAGGNSLQGCFIGVDGSGSTRFENGEGVLVGSVGNMIGGTAPGSGNVIAGNHNDGIDVPVGAASDTLIQGNLIGTDSSGSNALGNGSFGIQIGGAARTLVGGTSPAAGNTISGSGFSGIGVFGAANTVIQGNRIGTSSDGLRAIPNREGVSLSGNSKKTTIGGSASGAGNLISGNYVGIEISFSNDNTIQGNFIGTDVTGTLPLPNTYTAISLTNSSRTRIGGGHQGAGNRIAYNGRVSGLQAAAIGIRSDSNTDTGNLVSSNSIHDNLGLGIDLNDDGPTANDNGDGDVGANNRQNFPVITSTMVGPTTTTIVGFLNSAANTDYTVEFFSNSACGPLGHGQGKTLLGSRPLSIGSSGSTDFNFSFPTVDPSETVITATATDPNGNTSEFSACNTPVGAISLLPDGRTATRLLDANGTVFVTDLRSGASYSIELDVLPAAGTVTPVLAATTTSGSALFLGAVDRSGCSAATVRRLIIQPTSSEVSEGPIRITLNDTTSGYPIRVRVIETTLYCSRVSRNGYDAFADLQNTSDCDLSGDLSLRDGAGVSITHYQFAVPAGQSVQLAIPDWSPLIVGSAVLTHNGPPGAIVGGISMIQPGDASSANFRWPFVEVRSYGATDGK